MPRSVIARGMPRAFALLLAALAVVSLVSPVAAAKRPQRPRPRALPREGAAPVFDLPLGQAPLDTPLVVTGGFGEYRIGHFHAGFDFSTGGVTGKRVYAPLAGHIERIRTSGVGYGRSLYLRTVDGRTIQFGHLDAFVEPIASWVRAIQDSSGQYEQDLWPEASRFPIQLGQPIAWTGQSGAGGPHMHFEIRRGDMAYQPMRAGLRACDDKAPELVSLTLEPLDDTSYVQRGAAPYTVRLATGPETLTVIGRVRAIVGSRDGVWKGVDRMQPWLTRMDWDGQWIEARFDSVSWATDMVESDEVYDAGRVIGEKGIVLWAPRDWRPRVIHASAALASEAGTIVMRPGDAPKTLLLTARDAAGNRAEAKVVVRAEPRRAPKVEPGAPPRALVPILAFDSRPCELPGGAFRAGVEDPTHRYAAIQSGPDVAVPTTKSGSRSVAVLPAPGPEFRGFMVRHPDAAAVPGGWMTDPWEAVRVGPVTTIECALGSWRLEVPTGRLADGSLPGAWATLRDGEILWRVSDQIPAFSEGRRHASGLEIGPRALPLLKAARIEMRADTARTAGVYRWDGEAWSWIGSTRDAARGTFGGESRALGLFAVLVDTLAPRIGVPVSAGSKGGPYPRWAIETPLVEDGSGIDARASWIEFDGRRCPSEWDPEAGVLRWRPAARPDAGTHRVEVVASDKAGNVRRRTASLVLD